MSRLLSAARPLAFDSLGVFVFAVLTALNAGLIPATVAGIAVAAGVVGGQTLRGRPVAALQGLTLALVLISAGATLLTRDPRFMMAKPTAIYGAVAVAMLRRGWMTRYVPPEVPAGLITGFGYAWAGLMAATAMANAVVAVAFTAWWPAFIGIVPLGTKLVLFLGQFLAMQSRSRSAPDRASGLITGLIAGLITDGSCGLRHRLSAKHESG